ncbi:MAG TPA: hypothetical protein VK575_06320 [Gemmatimonadaceae bacterium]|nr:hypothetical protein [Gemmatimonadaceae bacterium]
MRIVLIGFVLSAQLSLPGFAPEIKSTTKITISAPHLVEPVEITDGVLLALSHVFSGEFIGEIAPTPDATFTRYTLTFDIQTLGGVKQAAYVVQYCVSDITDEGFVYLPGRGEPSHGRNISTIIRDGHDGYWHRASDDWNAAIDPYVRR